MIYDGHRNLVWTYVKNMPMPWFWYYLPVHLLATFFSLLYYSLSGHSSIIWRAKLDALRGLGVALRKRKEIQSTRTVRVSELRRQMNEGLLEYYRGTWKQRT